MWWKQNKWKVVVPVLILAALAGVFWYGGSAPGLQGWLVKDDTALSECQGQEAATTPNLSQNTAQGEYTDPTVLVNDGEELQTAKAEQTAEQTAEPEQTPEPESMTVPETGLESRPGGTEGGMTDQEKLVVAAEIAGGNSPGVAGGNQSYSEQQGMAIDPATGKDKYLTDPVPVGKPIPVEPQDVTISGADHTCTISISCATILNHMDWLDPEKVEMVPEDGWILQPTQVTFYEGESVFNVLQRTCKQQGIHMEFENTPMYNSAYIEGIHNLYEFDCGELSGWMYKVNEWFPNYGCSRYQLHEGDVICWVYTCDLGIDVDGYYSTGG